MIISGLLSTTSTNITAEVTTHPIHMTKEIITRPLMRLTSKQPTRTTYQLSKLTGLTSDISSKS